MKNAQRKVEATEHTFTFTEDEVKEALRDLVMRSYANTEKFRGNILGSELTFPGEYDDESAVILRITVSSPPAK